MICERPVSAGNGATHAGVHLGVGPSATDRIGLKISGLGGTAGATLATIPNSLNVMPLSPRQGGHRASMAGTIGLRGIGWVGTTASRFKVRSRPLSWLITVQSGIEIERSRGGLRGATTRLRPHCHLEPLQSGPPHGGSGSLPDAESGHRCLLGLGGGDVSGVRQGRLRPPRVNFAVPLRDCQRPWPVGSTLRGPLFASNAGSIASMAAHKRSI